MTLRKTSNHPTKGDSEPVEGFDGEILHPGLDIKDGILTLGFRYRDKSKK